MALILNIDTSIDNTYVSIAKDGVVLQEYFNEDQKSNTTTLHTNIKAMFEKELLNFSELLAVAVTNGPGSYTGLRVGLATAKGICYALNIPLITIGTLQMMAHFAINEIGKNDYLYCPMIDARRMEVFTALYDNNLNELEKPHALVLTPQLFADVLIGQKILFFGNGMNKLQKINMSNNSVFIEIKHFYNSMNAISLKMFLGSDFTNLAYSEPLYVKEFYNP